MNMNNNNNNPESILLRIADNIEKIVESMGEGKTIKQKNQIKKLSATATKIREPHNITTEPKK